MILTLAHVLLFTPNSLLFTVSLICLTTKPADQAGLRLTRPGDPKPDLDLDDGTGRPAST